MSDNPSAPDAGLPDAGLPGPAPAGTAPAGPAPAGATPAGAAAGGPAASALSPADAARAARPAGAWALLVSELRVLFARRRTWALLLALAAVPVLIAVAVRLAASTPQPGRGPPFLDQITQNGLFVAMTGLIVSIPLFLPLTVGVVAGDTIAGEASLGTLRYLLVAPAGRVWLLSVKYLGAAAFCLAATVTVVTAGVLAGLALFPVGPLTLLSGDTISLTESFGRALLIAGYVTVSLLGLSAIGLFFSTLTTVPVGAMAATIVLSVVAQVLDSLPQLDWLHPWLFSHYWLDFADLLRQPIDYSSFASNALLQGGYLLVFGALAYGRFVTKDILS